MQDQPVMRIAQQVGRDALDQPILDLAHRLPGRQTAAIAQAEDVLFHLLEDHPGDESILEAGLSLYDRLLQLSDFKLQSGGLPRDEVEESLAELLDLKG